MDSVFEDFNNKRSSASQAKGQLESIAVGYVNIAADIKKVETPKWLSTENKAKFDDMKTQYVEANEAMSSFATTFVKVVIEEKGSKEDAKKIKEYNAIRKDRLNKGLELVTYFEKGNWK